MAEPHPIPTDPRFQDLNGRTFGQLTVLFYAGRKSGKYSLWHCRCDCGQERTVTSSELTLRKTKSCLHCFRHRSKPHTRADAENLTGRMFGRLTVISLARRVKYPRSKSYWQCYCTCGESIVVRGDALKDGVSTSCGCLTTVREWNGQPKPETRICSKCGEEKPLTLGFFYNKSNHKWGFSPKCASCTRAEKKIAAKRVVGQARMKCLVAYSGDPPKCQCPGCNESHLEFLTIDHIDGNGAEHRRSINGQPMYPWLIKNKFPKGFRVLCWNCNCSRGRYHYCPHEKA